MASYVCCISTQGGISSKAKYAEFKLLLQNILQFNADINEHTLDVMQKTLKRDLYDINQQVDKYLQIVMVTSKERFHRVYKPGDIMIGLSGHITGSKVAEGIDKKEDELGSNLLDKREGRFNSFSL